tara:strand:- start:1326 stop:1643 length:318 start_codon:yes stop_codon:yes gene_type:complete
MKIIPIGYKVVVKLKMSELMLKAQSGLIEVPKEVLEREQRAMQEATVYALGPTAFSSPDFEGSVVKVGDLVTLAKYSGESRTDIEEGYTHLTINDEDIFSILIED